MTYENYLKKLADMQTQIKKLVPDSLKENGERRTNDLNKLRKSEGHMLAIVNTKTGEYKPVSEEMQVVRHGKWIDGYCSLCGCDAPAYIEDWTWIKDISAKYCPMCGARMDEE